MYKVNCIFCIGYDEMLTNSLLFIELSSPVKMLTRVWEYIIHEVAKPQVQLRLARDMVMSHGFGRMQVTTC